MGVEWKGPYSLVGTTHPTVAEVKSKETANQ